jgi:hypothetical protein
MFDSGLNDALLRDAVRRGGADVIDVAHGVGASAADLGVPLHEVFDHVERAYFPDEPSHEATRAAAIAWAESALIHHADVSCEDPLSSLASVPYVRTRLAEIYRGAESVGRRATDTSALVVVELPRIARGHELERSLQALDIAEALRLVFNGDETIAQLTTRRFGALVGRERTDETTLLLLRLLVERAIEHTAAVRIWVEHLPPSADGIAHVLSALCEK